MKNTENWENMNAEDLNAEEREVVNEESLDENPVPAPINTDDNSPDENSNDPHDANDSDEGDNGEPSDGGDDNDDSSEEDANADDADAEEETEEEQKSGMKKKEVTLTIDGSSVVIPVQSTSFNGRITKSGVAKAELFGYNSAITVLLYYPENEGLRCSHNLGRRISLLTDETLGDCCRRLILCAPW